MLVVIIIALPPDNQRTTITRNRDMFARFIQRPIEQIRECRNAWVFGINPEGRIRLERFVNLYHASRNAFKLSCFRVTHHQVTDTGHVIGHRIQIFAETLRDVLPQRVHEPLPFRAWTDHFMPFGRQAPSRLRRGWVSSFQRFSGLENDPGFAVAQPAVFSAKA
jgi:hypothetical protein